MERTCVGLDVHARSVVGCMIDNEVGEIVTLRLSPRTEAILDWVRSLPGPVAVTYEAGPTGFGLARALAAAGVRCEVVAPSKLERPPGDRVKTDRRDAEWLARLLRIGELPSVRVPSDDHEIIGADVDAVLTWANARRGSRTYVLCVCISRSGPGLGAWPGADPKRGAFPPGGGARLSMGKRRGPLGSRRFGRGRRSADPQHGAAPAGRAGAEQVEAGGDRVMPPDPSVGEETFARDPQLYLQATTRPGAELRHTWLVDADGQRISTLDVTGKGKFSLVTGLAGRSCERAVAKLGLPSCAPSSSATGLSRTPTGTGPVSARSAKPGRCWCAPTATSPGVSPLPPGTTPPSRGRCIWYRSM
nr:transposase [Pseudonocardia acidicola]